jgi:hypothetical protein
LERYVLNMYAEVVPVARRAHNSKESGKMTSLLNESERSSIFIAINLSANFLISAII